jgi:hypothetical protein
MDFEIDLSGYTDEELPQIVRAVSLERQKRAGSAATLAEIERLAGLVTTEEAAAALERADQGRGNRPKGPEKRNTKAKKA